MGFLQWLENSAPSQWVLGSDWGHPILLCFHAVGMGVVVGVVFMVNLRVLGYAKGVPLLSLEGLLRVAWTGFAMNALSGLALFCLNGDAYIVNTPFQIKIGLIAAGGLALWALWRTVLEAGGEPVTPKMRTMAVVTLVFWTGAILAGRLIAYTMEIGA